jgi:hypothetical protein
MLCVDDSKVVSCRVDRLERGGETKEIDTGTGQYMDL